VNTKTHLFQIIGDSRNWLEEWRTPIVNLYDVQLEQKKHLI